MVMHCSRKLYVGYQGKGMSLEPGSFLPNQPYTVIREATKEEWEIAHPGVYTNSKYFYEISTD